MLFPTWHLPQAKDPSEWGFFHSSVDESGSRKNWLIAIFVSFVSLFRCRIELEGGGDSGGGG